MAISVECPACGQTYRLKDEMAGRKIRCKACQTSIEVPLAEAEEEWGETSWPAKGSGRGGASRITEAVQKKSGNGKSVLVAIAAVAGLVLSVALVWGILKFLPSGNNQIADGTPAPAESSWVKFTLPDGSASALFPGEVKWSPLPHALTGHMAMINGNLFSLSNTSPMEISEDFLERNAESPSAIYGAEADSSVETINGNRYLRRTLMRNGEVKEVMATFIHNRRLYIAFVIKGSQSLLSPSDVDYFLSSLTFH